MEADLKIFDTVESTNITLSKLADEGAPEGTCVVALAQTKGQGRSGRTFYSPEGGNLYMSLLLRPSDEDRIKMITTMAAVAVVRALKEHFGVDAGIKWVNDIIYRDRKVCGIVAQAHNFSSDDMYIILGIGINIYASGEIPEEIAGIYGSVIETECDLKHDEQLILARDLAEKIVFSFAKIYESGDVHSHIGEYRKYSVLEGKQVEYLSGDKAVRATVCGIDDGGAIILERDGIRKAYSDGEIRIRVTDL